jgi:MFS family permease
MQVPASVLLVSSALVAALGGLLFGYDTAVIAGAQGFLQEHFALSDLALGWVAASALVGCMLGSVMGGWFGDRFGRKKALLFCAVLFFVSAIWSAVPGSATELVLARILGGLGVGAASMLTPVYIAEIAPAHRRGALTTLNQIAILVGMVVVYVVNADIAEAGDAA